MKISSSGCWQGWYPHGARGVGRGGQQDAALLPVRGHDQHGEQDGDHRGAHEDPHQHGDQAAARHARQVPHRAPRPRGREGQGSGEGRLCVVEVEDMTVTAAGHLLAAGQGGLGGQVAGHRPGLQHRGGARLPQGHLGEEVDRSNAMMTILSCVGGIYMLNSDAPLLFVTLSVIPRKCNVILL